MNFELRLEGMVDFTSWFWKNAGECLVFAVHGEMGAGKTTMIEALCKSRGVNDSMGSPTFSIINEYGFIEGERERKIYHIDLYRLKGEEEVISSGVEDCIYSGEYCFVEWPELAPWLFRDAAHIHITPVAEGLREVKLELPEAI